MEPLTAVLSGVNEVVPEVYATGLRAIQYQTLGELCFGAFLLLAGVVFIWYGRFVCASCETEGTWWQDLNAETDGFGDAVVIVLWTVGMTLIVCSLKFLLSVWIYVGLFDPEARMMREALRLLR